jgi:hypothetical protein
LAFLDFPLLPLISLSFPYLFPIGIVANDYALKYFRITEKIGAKKLGKLEVMPLNCPHLKYFSPF